MGGGFWKGTDIIVDLMERLAKGEWPVEAHLVLIVTSLTLKAQSVRATLQSINPRNVHCRCLVEREVAWKAWYAGPAGHDYLLADDEQCARRERIGEVDFFVGATRPGAPRLQTHHDGRHEEWGYHWHVVYVLDLWRDTHPASFVDTCRVAASPVERGNQMRSLMNTIVDPTDVFNIVRDRNFPTVEVADTTAGQKFRTPVAMYPDTNIQDEEFLMDFDAYDWSNKVLVVWEDEKARDIAIVKLQCMGRSRPNFQIFVSQASISEVIRTFPCLGHVGIPLPEYPSAITPSIYVSGQLPASQWTTFEDLGIHSVLNATDEVENVFEKEGLRYHNVRIEDSQNVDILPHLPEACDFIRDNLNEGRKVLVHCAYGRSRSVSMVLAHLIRDKQMSLTEATATVKARRSEAQANSGFQCALKHWETEYISP